MKRMMEAGREIDLVVFSNYLSTQDTDTNLKKNHLPRIHSFFLHSREKGKEKEKGKIGQRDGRWLREREREKKQGGSMHKSLVFRRRKRSVLEIRR